MKGEQKNILARKTPEIFPKTPKRIKKTQHHRPAPRFAHRVIAITPLFCRISTSVYDSVEVWNQD